MPAFIKATYEGEGKDDYALKARIAMDGLKDHPEEKEYILAYAACFLQAADKHKECITHCHTYLPEITIWDCRKDTLNTLVLSLEKSNRFAESITVRKQIVEETAKEQPGYENMEIEEMADAFKEAGDYKNAVIYYEQYLENALGDMDFYANLADIYEKLGDYTNSAKYYHSSLVAECVNSIWLWNNTGRALALAGKREEAQFYFETALKLSPGDAYAHYYLGQLYQDKDDVYRALHHYTEALKTKPEFSEVYNNLAVISYHENSNIKDAIANVEKALEQNTNPQLLITLYRNLANLYHKISDYDNEEYYRIKIIEAFGFTADHSNDNDEDSADKDAE